MMACHAPTATCTTTFSSRRLFNFLFIFIFCLVSLFGVVDAARGGVTRPCSSFSSLQNNKEKGDFFESIHCRPDDRRSGIVPRFFFFFFFHSSVVWSEQKKIKEIRSGENGQMTTAIVGTTIWRNNSIAGWTAIRILFFSSSIFFFYPSRPVLCVVCVCSSSSTSLRMISDALATPRLDASVRMEGTQSPPDGWVPYTVNHI